MGYLTNYVSSTTCIVTHLAVVTVTKYLKVKNTNMDQRTPSSLAGQVENLASVLGAAKEGGSGSRRCSSWALCHHLRLFSDERLVGFIKGSYMNKNMTKKQEMEKKTIGRKV